VRIITQAGCDYKSFFYKKALNECNNSLPPEELRSYQTRAGLEAIMAYLDEALKLDVRALMALAMKSGKQSAYSITITCPAGQAICGDLRDGPERVVTAGISVNWPDTPGDPVSGGILLAYRGWDDRAAEQTVYLTGTPAQVGGWLWRVTCSETRQQVPALYLAPDGDRFLSREATGLKYRRANSKADRYLRRCFKLMQKLKTDHFGPGIAKLSLRHFEKTRSRIPRRGFGDSKAPASVSPSLCSCPPGQLLELFSR
jgi:hypothetical protein